MASETILEDIDEKFLQCIICLCQLKEPKILPCLHHFCRDCLAKTVTEKDHDIECPTCREIHPLPQNGVDGFKTDFNMKNIIEFIQLRNSVKDDPTRACVACEKKLKASAYCFKCQDFLCESCHKFHGTNTIVKDHRPHLFPLSGMESRSLTMEKLASLKEAPRCPNHPGRLSELCCTTCDNLPICMACTYGAHRGHELQEVTTLAKLEREQLIKKMAELTGYKGKISRTKEELRAAIEKLDRNVEEKKAEIQEQFGSGESEINQGIKDIDDTLARRKTELEETLKRKTSERMQVLEREVKEAHQKYDRACREEKAEVDAELDKLLQENEGDKAKLHEQVEVMTKEFKDLLSSLQKQEAEHSKQIKDMLDHFDVTQERFENITMTASSILAAKDDWTDVQCIGNICAAIDPLIQEVKRDSPEVELLSDVTVGSLLSAVGRVNINEKEESVVGIEGVEGCNMSIWGIAGSRDGNCVVVTGGVKGQKQSHITVITMGGNKVKQTIMRATNSSGWHSCDFLSKFSMATVCSRSEIGIYDIRDHTYRKRDVSGITRELIYSVAADATNKHIIVGCVNSRDLHVFDENLEYIKKLTLPAVIRWPRDITVHEGDLLIWDGGGSSVYVVTMGGGSVCEVKHELPKPDTDGGARIPYSVCTDKNGFIHVLWIANSSASQQYKNMIVQYRQDGQHLLQTRSVACNDEIRSMTTVDTGRGEKILMATVDTGQLITYGLI